MCLMFWRGWGAPTVLESAPPRRAVQAHRPGGLDPPAGILGEGGVIRGRGTVGLDLRPVESFFHEANIFTVASPRKRWGASCITLLTLGANGDGETPASSRRLEVPGGRRFPYQPLPQPARANRRHGFLLTLERK